jgi:hypothetical protein
VRYCLVAFGLFAILASGARLHTLGRGFLILPEIILSWLPVFKIARTPARVIVLAYLFLAIPVGIAVEHLRQVRWGHWFAAVTIGLLVLDFVPVQLQTTELSCSPGYSLLRNDRSGDFGVLNLPNHSSLFVESYMAEAVCHGKPIAEIWIARNPASPIVNKIEMRDLARQRRQLIADRIKYIVLHKISSGQRDLPMIGRSFVDYEKIYAPVYSDAMLEIVRVY